VAAEEAGGTVTADTSREPSALHRVRALIHHWWFIGFTMEAGLEFINLADTSPVASTPMNFTLRGVAKGQTYYIVVSAYHQYKDQKDFSTEVTGVAK
jgi:hypothetical protein